MSHKHLSLSSFELAEDGSHLRMTQPSYLVIPDQRACWILNPEVIETYPRLRDSGFVLRTSRNDACRHYAPIAIFGSASAFAFNSFSARRYSTGTTLRNFGSQVFQFARMSAARFESVSLAWRVIRMCSRSMSDSRRLVNTSTLPCDSRSPEW